MISMECNYKQIFVSMRSLDFICRTLEKLRSSEANKQFRAGKAGVVGSSGINRLR